jgi:hypothetical protein
MAALNSGNNSLPGYNRFTFPQNDTSNYIQNVVFDASGSFFVPNSGNTTRPALSAPPRNLTTSLHAAHGNRKARRASDYWLPSLAPLGSVSIFSPRHFGSSYLRRETD